MSKTDCPVTFEVYMPPCSIGMTLWLLQRSGEHNHRLDECPRVHPAVEQEVLRNLSAKGDFEHKHAVVRAWMTELIKTRSLDFRNFIDSAFTRLHLSRVQSLDGTAIAGSPGGGRGRGSRHALVPAVLPPPNAAASEAPVCHLCVQPILSSSSSRHALACVGGICAPQRYAHWACVDGPIEDDMQWRCSECCVEEAAAPAALPAAAAAQPAAAEALAEGDAAAAVQPTGDALLDTFGAAAARLRAGVSSIEVVDTLGLPRAIFFYEATGSAMTEKALAIIVANAKRFQRENNTVAREFLQALEGYERAGWAKLHVAVDADGNATELHCTIIDPSQRAILYRCAGVGDVLGVDDSFGFFKSIHGVNLFAWMAPVAEAGGMTVPVMYQVFQAGSGIERDKSRALKSALDYLHQVRKELWIKRGAEHAAAVSAQLSGRATAAPPPPQPPRSPINVPLVQMSDKDQATLTALHSACLSLRTSDEAKRDVASLRKELSSLAEGASADAIAAGKLLLVGVPGVNADKSVRSFSIIPPTPSDLGAEPLKLDDSTRFRSVFSGIVVDSYGTILPGLAHAVLEEFDDADTNFRTSAHCGDSNFAAARMLSVLYFFERDSDAADTVQRYFLHFALLCYFHMLQAIRRKLHGHLKDVDLDAVIEGLRAVIVDGASWKAFKERFSAKLDAVELKLDSSEGTGRERFFAYFERFWLNARWHTTCCGRFRGLLERFGLNTNNDVELLWSTLKNHWLHGHRLGSGAAMLERIIGAPKATAVATTASVSASYSAQRITSINDAIDKPACVKPRAHRVALASAAFTLLSSIGAAPAERFIASAGGSYQLGAQVPGFCFSSRAKENSVGDVRAATEFGHLQAVWGPSRAQRWNQEEHDKSCGRGSAVARGAVRSAARNAVRGTASAPFDECAERVFQVPPGGEFLALSVPSAVRAAATAFHPGFSPLISRLEAAIHVEGDANVPRIITANQALREGMLSMWATLRRKDFDGDRPHVGYIYSVMVTMSAAQWLNEFVRVIERGERESLLFGDAPLPFGYRICINRMQRLARLVKADECPTTLLTGFYFGQEHKGHDSKTTFDRVDAHGTSDGSSNIKELQYRTRKRQLNMQFGRAVITPLGAVVIERRIVALLPSGEKHKASINAAEALAFVACARLGHAFTFLNDSPPGEQQRLLVNSYAGPARIVDMAAKLITELGGEAKALKLRLREVGADKLGVFLRDCLEAVHALLEHGNYAGTGSDTLAPDFRGSTRSEHASFSVFTLVTTLMGDMVEMEGDAGGPPRRVHTVVPWCNACDCSRVMAICPHLLAARILICVTNAPRTWHGNAEIIYWSAAKPPLYMPLRLAAAAEGSDTGLDVRAAAAAAEGMPAKVAMVAHQAALIMGCLDDADVFDSSMVARLLTVDKQLTSVLRSLEGISHIAAAPAAPRAQGRTPAAFPPRAGTPAEVQRARARSAALPVGLSPAQLLERLAVNHPLPDQPQLPAYPVQLPCSVVRGSVALAALTAAASRVASACREAAAGAGASLGAGAHRDGEEVVEEKEEEEEEEEGGGGGGGGRGAGSGGGGGRSAATGSATADDAVDVGGGSEVPMGEGSGGDARMSDAPVGEARSRRAGLKRSRDT